MSRFTASAFHKPSPFHFPHPPLSPPDTNSAEQPANPSIIGVPILDYDPTDSPAPRLRKVSSLSYHNSGLRDRERISHRNYKSFIVIIPPTSFIEEHGQLGQTLSFGPRHRLANGVLMPLFPTMYAQLNAIAREFNFPSTKGICLYLQHTENGITVTPRISDESWQMIWSHVFEAPSPLSPGPPICGKVEFDIDQRHARWYTAWLSSSHHPDHTLDISMSMVPSTAPSISHFREESRITFDEDHDAYIPRSAPAVRHVPRKLSLVDRLENLSNRSAGRSARPALESPENGPSTTQTLSPIFQEDEPKTAKLILEKKVESWRASAKLYPSALAATGQISLEPANLPNSMNVDLTSDPAAEDELNLEDYTWSISSVGPNDYDPDSPVSLEYRVPSVHLVGRLEGSVCLTPSICTSSGPSDYTLSPLPSPDFLPSPDIAYRLYDYAPLTPTTATSWGPPSVYSAPSPTESEFAYSVDLGDRAVFSPPLTPTTATSWGPASWPPSPLLASRPPSVHLGDRCEFSRPVTPSYLDRDFSMSPVSSFRLTQGLPYPYLSIYPSVYPNFDLYPGAFCLTWSGQYQSSPNPGYPSFQLYLPVYPHFDLYPAVAGLVGNTVSQTEPSRDVHPELHSLPHDGNLGLPQSDYKRFPSQYMTQFQVEAYSQEPAFHQLSYLGQLYKLYPYFKSNPAAVVIETSPRTSLHLELPFLRPVQQVYAHFSSRQLRAPEPVFVSLMVVYPDFNIYPAQYPQFDLYPRKLVKTSPTLSESPIRVRLSHQYPHFILYPARYPWNLEEIYPPCSLEDLSVELSVLPPYPCFDLYPAVYPHLIPYPPVQTVNFPTASNASESQERRTPQRPKVPAVPAPVESRRVIFVKTPPVYGAFNLYPAVYPAFDLYPASSVIGNSTDWSLSSGYPTFNLYPAVYPHFDLYPPIYEDKAPTYNLSCSIDVAHQYPVFDIYPSAHSSIGHRHVTTYPTIRGTGQLPAIKVTFEYPVFNMYTVAYPHFDIYPQLNTSVQVAADQIWVYPFFDIYPAIYPHFNIYPAGISISDKDRHPWIQPSLENRYPFFELYPQVYPFFPLYASLQPFPLVQLETALQQQRRQRKTHAELHSEVFPTGVVSTPSGNAARFSTVDPIVRMSLTRQRSGTVARGDVRAPRLMTATLATSPTERPSPVKEAPAPLTRSSSASIPTRPVTQVRELDRSHSASVRPKRDSIVLQRVKALNNASIEEKDEDQNAKAGLPPISRNPLRSRYPFA